jgi:YgiT-type zinc finger domain-containing protein
MTCHICGGPLSPCVTTLPVKEDHNRIVIIKGVPLLQCDNCREYVIEDAVMDRIDTLLSKGDATVELEVLNYAT